MRIVTWTLTGLLLSGTWLLAQQPPPVQVQPAPQPPADPALDAVLAKWENAMMAVNSFHIDLSRTNLDKAYGTVEKFEGAARFQKPNKALLYLASKTNANNFEKFVINGLTLYEWAPSVKKVRIHQLPPPKNGQMADNNFLSFIAGMKAADAKQRYAMKMMPPPAGDTYYSYIEILPRDPTDRQDFSRARLVLTISTGLPRQLWFQQPNGNEVTWDFNDVKANIQLPAVDFERPTALPPGWELQAVQPDGPRVVRPQGP
jgi:TIGR03009 family protein